MNCIKCGKEEDHLTSQEVAGQTFQFYNCSEALLSGTIGTYVVPSEFIQRMMAAEQTAKDIISILMGVVRTKGLQTPQGWAMTVNKQAVEIVGHINVEVNQQTGLHKLTVTDQPLVAQQVIKA